MDPLTQGALGAACAEAALHPYQKRPLTLALVGALGGMAADVDLLIHSNQNPMIFYYYHRHFTHSFIFILPGGLLVTFALMLFKRFRKCPWITFFAATIGYATHALLDACTSYGTLLLWPFSMVRFSWDVISIIDVFFTLPLVLGVTWTVVFDDRKGVFFGLSLAAVFLLFNTLQHERAIEATRTYAREQHWKLDRLRAIPFLTRSTHWRAVAFVKNKLMIADVKTPLFHPSEVSLLNLFPKFSHRDLPDYIYGSSSQQLQDYTIFNWFCDGYVIQACEKPFILVDGRYIIGNNPPVALWGITFKPHHQHVVPVRTIHLNQCDTQ